MKLFASYIPNGNHLWEVLLILLQIIDLVSKPIFEDFDLIRLENKLENIIYFM